MKKLNKMQTFMILGISVLLMLGVMTSVFPRNSYLVYDQNQLSSQYKDNILYQFVLTEKSKLNCSNEETDINTNLIMTGSYEARSDLLKIEGTNCRVKSAQSIKLSEQKPKKNNYQKVEIKNQIELKNNLLGSSIQKLSDEKVLAITSSNYDGLNLHNNIIGQSKNYIYIQLSNNIYKIKQNDINNNMKISPQNSKVIPKISSNSTVLENQISFNEFLLINENIIAPEMFIPNFVVYEYTDANIDRINDIQNISVRNNLDTKTIRLKEEQKFFSNSFDNDFDKLFLTSEITPQIRTNIKQTNAKVYIIGGYDEKPSKNIIIIK
jgi:hypothetical protein